MPESSNHIKMTANVSRPASDCPLGQTNSRASTNPSHHQSTRYSQTSRVRSPALCVAKTYKISESLDKNKEHIKEEVTNAVDATTKELLQRIQTSEEDFSRRVAAAAINDEAFFLPLAEEGIEYARRDGSQSSKTTLGAQMKMFRKKVAAEEKELESLWKQWAQVEEELEVAAVEALGIDWPTILAGVSAGNLGETVKNDMGENEEAVERDCKRFEELINTTSEAAVDKMAQSEKVSSLFEATCLEPST